jgi:putative lipoic acid-binding regulatory protein
LVAEPVAEQDPPKIEFPCDYPIKVLGRDVPDFQATVIEVFERHAQGFDRERITIRVSREGTFAAMTIFITATGKPQLEALHADLLATGMVQMVI